MHTILPHLLRRTVKVAVVGCGGTGSAVISGLPHLHQALLAYGHPSGLYVTVMDGDRISATNCVRQPFSASEIGLFKSVVLINRLNLFWGLDWEAVPQHVNANHDLRNDFDLVIGCVDSRAARAKIHETVRRLGTPQEYRRSHLIWAQCKARWSAAPVSDFGRRSR